MKNIALVALVAFVFTFALPVNHINAAVNLERQPVKQVQTQAKINTGNSPTKSEPPKNALKSSLQELEQNLQAQDVERIKSSTADMRKALQDLRVEIQGELDRNEKVLKQINARAAMERNRQFRDMLESKIKEANLMLDEFEPAFTENQQQGAARDRNLTNAKLDEIKKLIAPEAPQPALGNELPHRNIQLNPPAPPTSGGITPAYKAAAGSATGAALTFEPTPEDLAPGPETAFTEAIDTAADLLPDDALAVYEYVRNTITFEPYYGSRKGATGTLEQESGNDYDQASLLIALLRYKQIPARYVTGTVEIPADKAMKWVGAETPEAAIRILASAGIPTVSVISGGRIAAVRLEHTWVQALVPYENYRGQYPYQGGRAWVPLDPSFKQHEIKPGLDFTQISGLDVESLIDIMRTTGEVSPDKLTITNMNFDPVDAELKNCNERVESYLQEHGLTNATLDDVFGGKRVIYESLAVLPASLPYKTVVVTRESASVPDSMAASIGFSIRGQDPFGLNFSGTPDFSYRTKAFDLSGKRITLSWAPATSEDEAVIKHYGGLFNTPAYLVKVIPQLKIDGQVAASGQPVGLGYRQEFTISVKEPGMPEDRVVNSVTTGSFYAVGLNYQQISPLELSGIAERLEALAPTLTGDNIYSDEGIGEILNGVAKAYFAQLDLGNKILAERFNVNSTRLISEAITAYSPRVKYLFMSPVDLSPGGLYIDVDRNIISVVSLNGDENNETAFVMASGILGSAMEHIIFEEMLNVQSVSTIKILEEANKVGIPIYTVTKQNINVVLPQLEVNQSVKKDIVNAVNSDRIVTIPKTNISLNQWQGTGYIVLDPETGAAGYMISGGIAGGSTTVITDLAALVSLIFGFIDVYLAASMLLAVSTPIGGLVALALFTLAAINLNIILNSLYIYYLLGDEEAAEALITNAILSLATLGLIGAARVILERLKMICFTEDTPVYTPEGHKPIKDIQAGDDVYAWDPETGQTGVKKVKHVSVSKADSLVRLHIGNTEVRTTPAHPFIALGNGWVAAGAIGAGDRLLRYHGDSAEVDEVYWEQLAEPVTVYNLTVEDYHTYCVSNYDLVVHNKCKPPVPDSVPINKKGELYPKVKDAIDNEVPYPGDCQWIPPEQRVDRLNTDAYKKWWQDTKNGGREPDGGWGEWRIHHIRPVSFGGTNDYNNLVPVRAGNDHQSFTNWWNNNRPWIE